MTSPTPATPGTAPRLPRRTRARRSNLAVPGSSPKMLAKARTLAVDQVFLDLEDAVAPVAKEAARANVVAALREGGWGERVRAVRMNDWTTPWALQDVLAVVRGAGDVLDCLVLPKVQTPEQVVALDLLLCQLEAAQGLPVGGIGIEVQIENALGLLHVDRIAAASARVETLVFGPGDFVASTGMRTLVVGEQPPGYDVGDAYHHVLTTILVAARAHDVLAIDGPYPRIRDVEGFRRVAARSAALGFDGTWVLHPAQVEAANEVFSPRQADFDRAEDILRTYAHATSEAGGARGAVLLDGEMLDEATRKVALVVSARGRAAGMRRSPDVTREGNT